MAQALSDIIKELDTSYQPQRDQYSQSISQVDPQQQAEEQGLQAAKTDAFSQINQDANRRGMYYAGLPISEEQRYTGQNYLPAVANLRAKYAQQKFDLTNALNKVTTDEYNQANSIQQTQLDREEKQREFDAQLAAQTAAAKAAAGGNASPSFGFGGDLGGAGAGAAPAGHPQIQQRPGGGFNFQNPNGQAISAAQYSQLTGIPFRSLLQTMANAGDKGAASALGLVGNDYGFNRTKISSQGQVQLLQALGLNTGGYNYAAPKAPLPPPRGTSPFTNALAGGQLPGRIR